MRSGTLPKKNFHKHHITYKPELVDTLCFICHNLITEINTMGRLLKKSPLSNEERLKIYKLFKSGWFDNKPPRKNRMKKLFGIGIQTKGFSTTKLRKTLKRWKGKKK